MRERPTAVMMFAAGFGTRMKPLTDTTPKPLLKVGDKSLLNHSLDLAKAVSPEKIVVNTHYLSDQIEAHLANEQVHISVEDPQILDTGGGLRKALPYLGEGPVWTSNTDAIWRGPNPFAFAREAWDSDHMDALLVCIPIENTIGRADDGDFAMTDDHRLQRGPGFVYGGVQIIKTDLLHTISDTAFSLNRLWDQMESAQRLFGCCYPGRWADVGHPAGLLEAEALLDV